MSIREISKELQEVAIKEINEDPKRIPNDLAYIKEWLSKQSHIKARTDDQFLIAFLRGTKYSLERTKEKLDMHYTLKTITPEIYANRDPFDPEIQKILSVGLSIPLPKLPHPGAPRYVILRNGPMEKYKFDQAKIFKVSTMIQDIMLLEDDNLAISGIMMVQDMSDMSLGYIRTLNLGLAKKAMTCFQNGYPHRIKGSHIFNASGIFEAMYAIFKPFLTEKIRKRMRVYGSMEELYETVPKEIFPEEYGGDGGKLDDLAKEWKAKIESYSDWFKADQEYGTDEKKRPGKPKTAESVFGLEGSFRQLSVD